MNSDGLKKRLEALRERRARIDAEIEQEVDERPILK